VAQQRGEVGACALGPRREVHQHTLIQTFKKRVFPQKFKPKIWLKMRVFLEKGTISAAPGGSAAEPPLAFGGRGHRSQTTELLLPLTDIDLSKCVSIVNLY